MNPLGKRYYHTWNIGFVERSINDILLSDDNEVKVNWVKHSYKDRFFADPFILSADDKIIKVLVEDFPYYDKRGMISLLTIDRKTYELIDKKVVLKQPFHMSYPFIMKKNGEVWVAPEASMSGKLYRYFINPSTGMLDNQTILLDEPVLDSTIIEYNGKYWLFCTKKGIASNKDLFIYYSGKPEGPWSSHKRNPVVSDAAMARPAGNMVIIDNVIYRVVQKCDLSYGEAINVTRIEKLSEEEFSEVFIKEIRAQKDKYSNGFHTINGMENICVVDGIKKDFAPFRRIYFEICNYLKNRG